MRLLPDGSERARVHQIQIRTKGANFICKRQILSLAVCFRPFLSPSAVAACMFSQAERKIFYAQRSRVELTQQRVARLSVRMYIACLGVQHD